MLQQEHTKVCGDRDRLSAALLVEQQNNQLLIADGNTRYRAANTEVERLRQLCKEHGINPNED